MNKLSKIFLSIIIFLALVVFILSYIMFSKKENKYDVSFMHKTDINESLNLIDSDNYHVFYVGRETCELCEDILPSLKEAQLALNFTTQYLDITEIDRSSEEWKEFASKLTMKSTQYLNETDVGEAITETYGYFLSEYGFTPTIIVTKSGKQVAGFIGVKSPSELISFLKTKGID